MGSNTLDRSFIFMHVTASIGLFYNIGTSHARNCIIHFMRQQVRDVSYHKVKGKIDDIRYRNKDVILGGTNGGSNIKQTPGAFPRRFPKRGPCAFIKNMLGFKII